MVLQRASEVGLPLLSVCIPVNRGRGGIGSRIEKISSVLREAAVPFEFIITHEGERDEAESEIRSKMSAGYPIKLIIRKAPHGFGWALRSCLAHLSGDMMVVVMPEDSDDPRDIVRFYYAMGEGHDAVFGSRFERESSIQGISFATYWKTRLANKFIQWLFGTQHSDLTHSFKAYRVKALRSLSNLLGAHAEISLEISLGLIVRKCKVVSVPTNWHAGHSQSTSDSMWQNIRRYTRALLRAYSEKLCISENIETETERVEISDNSRGSVQLYPERELVISNISVDSVKSAFTEKSNLWIET